MGEQIYDLMNLNNVLCKHNTSAPVTVSRSKQLGTAHWAAYQYLRISSLSVSFCFASKEWPYIINIMWLLIQSCSLCVSQDYVFYIPFYLAAETPAWFQLSLISFFFSVFSSFLQKKKKKINLSLSRQF